MVTVVLVFVVLAHSPARASTLFYLSAAGADEGAAPVSPQETLEFLPDGGSFHIWVQPDTLFSGISLDLEITGAAISFTGATVHNPIVGSDTRWLPSLIRNGTISGSKISRIEGGALVPLTSFGVGVGPTTSSGDPLYESSGGFLFATIDFDVPSPTETATVSLAVGHNLLSGASGLYSGSILFGASDGPVANSVGSTGTTLDLNLVARPLHPSDFDSDGDVDGVDLLTWQKSMGITSGATRSQGDADGDGQVDSDDLGLWESQYGTTPIGAVAALVTVPEASTFSLFLCGLILYEVKARCKNGWC